MDMAEVLKAAVETVQPAADARGIGMTIVLDSQAGPIRGDPNRLQQVFWNLLNNAVKFTPSRGTIRICLERVESHLQVRVQDTGEGIKPEFLTYVFDRFRQENATTTRRHGGLGLGLAIVKQLVELHGGAISVMSPGPGQGSTFSVSLPIRTNRELANVDGRPAPKPAEAHPDTRVSLAGLRILVVDDEPDAGALLRRLLEDRGAHVLLCESADAAFKIIATQPLDMLLSDIGMPHEDGYSLMRRVRQLPAQQGGKIPAVALTAYVRDEDRNNALGAGFHHHLTKPVQAGELIATIALLSAGQSQC
jgi:CheY-like chemotaxis protein